MHSRIFVVTRNPEETSFVVTEEDARCVNPGIDYITREDENDFNQSLEWLISCYPNNLIINEKEKTWTVTKDTPLIYFGQKYQEFLEALREMSHLADTITLERYAGVEIKGSGDFEYVNYIVKNLYECKDGFILYLADEGYCVSLDCFIRNLGYYTKPEENPILYIIGSYDYHA